MGQALREAYKVRRVPPRDIIYYCVTRSIVIELVCGYETLCLVADALGLAVFSDL
jgi:hypothetical protein